MVLFPDLPAQCHDLFRGYHAKTFVIYRSDDRCGDAYWVSASDEAAARGAVVAATTAKEANCRTKYACRSDDTELRSRGYIHCRLDGSNSRVEIAIL